MLSIVRSQARNLHNQRFKRNHFLSPSSPINALIIFDVVESIILSLFSTIKKGEPVRTEEETTIITEICNSFSTSLVETISLLRVLSFFLLLIISRGSAVNITR